MACVGNQFELKKLSDALLSFPDAKQGDVATAFLRVCYGADQPCPTCDAGVGVSCSDYERVQYNPAGILIQRAVSGGSEEKIQGDQVICFQRAACGNGTWFIGAACPGGWGCIGPVPAWCQYCTQVGNWNVSWVYNWRCSGANCGG